MKQPKYIAVRGICALALCLASAALVAQDGALPGSGAFFGVSPMRLHLEQPGKAQQLRVRNEARTSLTVQVRAFAWRQVDGEDIFERSHAVKVVPSMVTIAPRSEGSLNVFFPEAMGTDGEHRFKIVVDEIPSAAMLSGTGAATRLRMTLPLFINRQRAEPPRLDARVANRAITVTNQGGATVKLVAVRVVNAKGTPQSLDMSNGEYVLGGSYKVYPLPEGFACEQGLRLTGSIDGKSFDAPVAAHCA